ncbi:MAG: glycosyltransferase family 2 protein [Methanobacterium sp.]|nr:glycosyltransferase family 2 protein [Methanobacterium sp.]
MNNNKNINQGTCSRVSIVIINWNNWKDTLECLKSVFKINYSSFQIVLVDNDSSDDSINQIKDFSKHIPVELAEFDEKEIGSDVNRTDSSKEDTESDFKSTLKTTDFKFHSNTSNLESNFSKKLILIKNHENYGFAGGNNIGMDFALEYLNPDYVLLLNNDTTVDEYFLDELLKLAGNNESVGSVQPVLLNDSGETIDSLGQECYWWGAEDICMGYPLKNSISTNSTVDGTVGINGIINDMEIFGSCAAAALDPSEVLKKTGLFDEDFFVELEDVDLSWKIRLCGYKSFLAGKARVYHKRGVSGTISSQDLIKGMKKDSMVLKWHRQSKNWLIIVLRYYPAEKNYGNL